MALIVLSLIGVVLAVYLVHVLRRPSELFRRYVVDPIPASVTHIQVDQPMRHGGYGYVFRFGVSQADFERIRNSRPFREAVGFRYSDPVGVSCAWKTPRPPYEEIGPPRFAMYAIVHSPSWLDLAAWKNPETYALVHWDKQKGEDIQLLIYNRELGRAYCIVFHYRVSGIF